MNKNIHELELHETTIISVDGHMGTMHNQITRVPGGWIYCLIWKTQCLGTQFVPFSKEFKIWGGNTEPANETDLS